MTAFSHQKSHQPKRGYVPANDVEDLCNYRNVVAICEACNGNNIQELVLNGAKRKDYETFNGNNVQESVKEHSIEAVFEACKGNNVKELCNGVKYGGLKNKKDQLQECVLTKLLEIYQYNYCKIQVYTRGQNEARFQSK